MFFLVCVCVALKCAKSECEGSSHVAFIIRWRNWFCFSQIASSCCLFINLSLCIIIKNSKARSTSLENERREEWSKWESLEWKNPYCWPKQDSVRLHFFIYFPPQSFVVITHSQDNSVLLWSYQCRAWWSLSSTSLWSFFTDCLISNHELGRHTMMKNLTFFPLRVWNVSKWGEVWPSRVFLETQSCASL